jgi:uncharacterized protein YceK
MNDQSMRAVLAFATALALLAGCSSLRGKEQPVPAAGDQIAGDTGRHAATQRDVTPDGRGR